MSYKLPRLIDGDKLLEWLEGRKFVCGNQYAENAYGRVEENIIRGTFDIPSNQGESARLAEQTLAVKDDTIKFLDGQLQQVRGEAARLREALDSVTEERNGYKELLSQSETAYNGLIELIRTLPDKITQLDSFADSEEYSFPLFQCNSEDHDVELEEWFGTFSKGLGEHARGIVNDLLDGIQLKALSPHTEDTGIQKVRELPWIVFDAGNPPPDGNYLVSDGRFVDTARWTSEHDEPRWYVPDLSQIEPYGITHYAIITIPGIMDGGETD